MIDRPMKTKSVLTLDDVRRVAAAAEAEALRHNWAVTIAIVDDGGHLLWLQRLDGAAALSAHMAPAKARTSALGRRESRIYEEMINQGRTSFLSAPDIEGLLEGGVPIMVSSRLKTLRSPRLVSLPWECDFQRTKSGQSPGKTRGWL
jgi:glc operon protein GlcG